MGVLLGVEHGALIREDQSSLTLSIGCPDLNLVPFILRVGHGGNWTDCRVYLHGRDSLPPHLLDEPPDEPPPPDLPPSPPHLPYQPDPNQPNNDLHPPSPPYVPPARRQHRSPLLHLPEPNLIGPPAAGASRANRSMVYGDEPSLRKADGTLNGNATSLGHAKHSPLQGDRAYSPGVRPNLVKPDSVRGSYEYIAKKGDTCLQTTWRMYKTGNVGDYYAKGGHASQPALHSPFNTWDPERAKPDEGDPLLSPCPCVFTKNQKIEPSFWPHLQDKYSPTRCPKKYTSYLSSQRNHSCFPPTCNRYSHLLKPPSDKEYHHTPPPILQRMAGFSEDDERLIAKFVGLCTKEKTSVVKVPIQATSSNAWDLSLLAKVVTDRTVLDLPFHSNMIKAWAVDPATTFRPVTKNCYLVEFTNTDDLYRASLGGPWTYRGDLVATRKVSSHADLNPNHISSSNMWVQLHNLPLNAFADKGIHIIARELGTPVAAPLEGFVNGRRFTKVKVLIPLSEPLKDYVIAEHPTLGEITVHCVYEKVTRVCRFCGELGHEMHHCPEHLRLTALLQDSTHGLVTSPEELLAPKLGAWILNPLQVPTDSQPNPVQAQSNSGLKRTYNRRANSPVAHRDQSTTDLVIRSTSPTGSNPVVKKPRPAGHIPSAQDI